MKHTIISRIGACLLLLLLPALLLGCGTQNSAPTEASAIAAQSEIPRLELIVQINKSDEPIYKEFTSDDLNGNYGGKLEYHDVTAVSINLDGEVYPLEEALRDGRVSWGDLLAWAQIDAREHYCSESMSSENGLAEFQYRYNGYQLAIIHDLYETPDGQLHLIQEIDIMPANLSIDDRIFLKDGGGPGDRIDREDWGLNFEVTEAYPTYLTVKCDQSGGQQFGKLFIYNLEIFDEEKNGRHMGRTHNIKQGINMDGTTTFEIDWETTADPLPLGNYILRLRVEDAYTEEDIPPLSRNYYDRQIFEVDFTVQ